jgi:hypothetical protein
MMRLLRAHPTPLMLNLDSVGHGRQDLCPSRTELFGMGDEVGDSL